MSFLKSLARWARRLNPTVDEKAVASVVDTAELRTGLTLLDGSILQAGVIHANKGYTLVGVDHLGNKYYQADTNRTLTNRDRVVVFGPRFMKAYGEYDASCVTPEWHAWLHHMSDDLPPNVPKPFYHIDKQPYDPKDPYLPKGHHFHGENKRSWKKFESWTPSQQ